MHCRSDLRFCPGQARVHVGHTVLNEGIDSVRVVDTPRAMVNIEHLVGLGDGAKEEVVGARAFFFLMNPTAVPSVWRPVLNTDPSKSSVTVENLSTAKRSMTRCLDSIRTLPMLRLSALASERLRVDTPAIASGREPA